MATPSQALLRFFDYQHLTDENLRRISYQVQHLAMNIEDDLPDGPEKTAGLRKLLEAKDCFVRAALPQEPSVDDVMAGRSTTTGLPKPPPDTSWMKVADVTSREAT